MGKIRSHVTRSVAPRGAAVPRLLNDFRLDAHPSWMGDPHHVPYLGSEHDMAFRCSCLWTLVSRASRVQPVVLLVTVAHTSTSTVVGLPKTAESMPCVPLQDPSCLVVNQPLMQCCAGLWEKHSHPQRRLMNDLAPVRSYWLSGPIKLRYQPDIQWWRLLFPLRSMFTVGAGQSSSAHRSRYKYSCCSLIQQSW